MYIRSCIPTLYIFFTEKRYSFRKEDLGRWVYVVKIDGAELPWIAKHTVLRHS